MLGPRGQQMDPRAKCIIGGANEHLSWHRAVTCPFAREHMVEKDIHQYRSIAVPAARKQFAALLDQASGYP